MSLRENPIGAVVHDGLCIGCGACALIPGSTHVCFAESPDGFIIPQTSGSVTASRGRSILSSVCPGRVVCGPRQRNWSIWGPVLGGYAGYAADQGLRYRASSGGALTAICAHLLASGSVDVVATLGSDYERPLRPVSRLIRSPNDLQGTEGSRYCPSSPVAILAQTKPSERVAFVGRPCDVAAVRQLAAAGIEAAQRVSVFLSFFCAGVPSYLGTDALLDEMGVRAGDVREFRYRGNGWPGSSCATTDQGSSLLGYHESWASVLTRFRHDRCKICADGTGELADLAFADAWHRDGSGPSFHDAEGRSLVLARSAVGQSVLDRARNANAVLIRPFDPAEIEAIQPYQASRKRAVAARLLGRWLVGSTSPRYRRLGVLSAARKMGRHGLATEAKGAAARAVRAHPRAWHRWVLRIARELGRS